MTGRRAFAYGFLCRAFFLAGMCVSCASQSEQIGDAAITAGAAGVGALAAGPLGAAGAGGVASFWTAVTGGPELAVGPDGQVVWQRPLGFFARIGRFIDTWLWWSLGALLLLWVLFPRTRSVITSLVSWPSRLLRGEVTPAEAAADVVLAVPRAVGLVHSSVKAQDAGRKEARRAAAR